MDKIKSGFKFVCGLLVEGYEFVTDQIADHPKIAFWVLFGVAVVAILK